MTRLLWLDQINRPFDAIPQSRDSTSAFNAEKAFSIRQRSGLTVNGA